MARSRSETVRAISAPSSSPASSSRWTSSVSSWSASSWMSAATRARSASVAATIRSRCSWARTASRASGRIVDRAATAIPTSHAESGSSSRSRGLVSKDISGVAPAAASSADWRRRPPAAPVADRSLGADLRPPDPGSARTPQSQRSRGGRPKDCSRVPSSGLAPISIAPKALPTVAMRATPRTSGSSMRVARASPSGATPNGTRMPAAICAAACQVASSGATRNGMAVATANGTPTDCSDDPARPVASHQPPTINRSAPMSNPHAAARSSETYQLPGNEAPYHESELKLARSDARIASKSTTGAWISWLTTPASIGTTVGIDGSSTTSTSLPRSSTQSWSASGHWY